MNSTTTCETGPKRKSLGKMTNNCKDNDNNNNDDVKLIHVPLHAMPLLDIMLRWVMEDETLLKMHNHSHT